MNAHRSLVPDDATTFAIVVAGPAGIVLANRLYSSGAFLDDAMGDEVLAAVHPDDPSLAIAVVPPSLRLHRLEAVGPSARPPTQPH